MVVVGGSNKLLQLTMPAHPLRRWVPLLMTLTLLPSCNGDGGGAGDWSFCGA